MFDIKTLSTKYPKIATAIACLLALIIFTNISKLLSLDKIIDSFELKTLDWRFSQTEQTDKIDKNIILVVLDDSSLQKAESSPELNLTTTIPTQQNNS